MSQNDRGVNVASAKKLNLYEKSTWGTVNNYSATHQKKFTINLKHKLNEVVKERRP